MPLVWHSANPFFTECQIWDTQQTPTHIPHIRPHTATHAHRHTRHRPPPAPLSNPRRRRPWLACAARRRAPPEAPSLSPSLPHSISLELEAQLEGPGDAARRRLHRSRPRPLLPFLSLSLRGAAGGPHHGSPPLPRLSLYPNVVPHRRVPTIAGLR